MTRKKEKRKVNMYFIFLEWWIMCYNRRKKIGMPWKHRLTKRLVENATKIIKSQKTFSLHRPKQTLGIESSGYTHVLIFPLFAPPPPRQKKDTQKDWQNWVASLTKRTCQKADGTTSAAFYIFFFATVQFIGGCLRPHPNRWVCCTITWSNEPEVLFKEKEHTFF